MKTRFLLLFILLATCSFAKYKHGKAIDSSPGPNGLYKFTGKLNSKIPVFIWFVVKDSAIKGEVTYLKTAKRVPITVAGQITKDFGTIIYEFTKKGNVTGVFEGALNAGSLDGKWWSPGSAKVLPFKLIPKDTELAPVDMNIKPVTINGTYEYHFNKGAGDGGVNIKQVSPGNYLIDMSCVTAAPAFNLATLELFKTKMVNGVILVNVPETDCRFIIRPFNGFIIIDRVAGEGGCGFGLNASIQGVFMKTSDVATVGQIK